MFYISYSDHTHMLLHPRLEHIRIEFGSLKLSEDDQLAALKTFLFKVRMRENKQNSPAETICLFLPKVPYPRRLEDMADDAYNCRKSGLDSDATQSSRMSDWLHNTLPKKEPQKDQEGMSSPCSHRWSKSTEQALAP